jgi:hypothetical protein
VLDYPEILYSPQKAYKGQGIELTFPGVSDKEKKCFITLAPARFHQRNRSRLSHQMIFIASKFKNFSPIFGIAAFCFSFPLLGYIYIGAVDEISNGGEPKSFFGPSSQLLSRVNVSEI